MKLSLLSAAPALLLASSAAFAQTPAPVVAPADAAAPAAATPATAVPDAPVTATAPAPVVLVVPVAATPAAPPEVLPPLPPPAFDLPTKLGISKDGFFQPSANLQFWIFGANQAGDTVTTLRLRRAELRVKGEIIPKLFGFNVMIDPARAFEATNKTVAVTPATTPPGSVTVAQPTAYPNLDASGNLNVLQDYNITFMSDYADVSVGQFKVPLSLEGYNSATKILFPERAVVSRRYGDQRDIGIKVEKKLCKNFYYQAAIFNGEGQNKLDSNAQKDAALRLEVYPIDGITIGAVGYAGIHNRAHTGAAANPAAFAHATGTKDRVEGDFKLDLAHVLVQAEYIHGWDGPTALAREESAGVYAVVGYTIADKIQPLFRIGRYDPNVRGNANPGQRERGLSTTPNDELTSYEVGLNYYLRGNDAKLQASYSFFDFDQDLNRAEVILSAQASF
jgi:Phosphate-selective porin O and P